VEGNAVFRAGGFAGIEVDVTAGLEHDEGKRVTSMVIESLRES